MGWYLSAESELGALLAEEEAGLDVVVLGRGGVDVGVDDFAFGASADAGSGSPSDFRGDVVEGIAAG